MGEVLGRPVKAQAIPRAQRAAPLEGFGVPGAEPVAGTTTAAQVFVQAKKD